MAPAFPNRPPEGSVGARYLVRLDDACDTMPGAIWSRIEHVLLEAKIRPMVAVIPSNRDPKMLIDDPDPRFWERVREWQRRGWAIGLHGLHHVMRRRRGRNTEFAGLSRARQEELVAAGLDVFSREGVRPDVWMAPNHTFDRTTVGVLAARNLRVISDGHTRLPYRDSFGLLRVPQQLARFATRPEGLWTVCRHPNVWEMDDVDSFERDLRRFSDRIVDLPWVVERFSARRRDARDVVAATRRRAWGALARARTGIGSRRMRDALEGD